MRFQFDSVTDFLAMSGHGPYVWASYVITLGVLAFLLISPLVQRKAFIKQQQKLQRLSQANSAAIRSVD